MGDFVPSANSSAPSPWPRRLAWWTWWVTIPLVFFGASVTSTHSGLAIDGWLIVDPGKGDWFLPLYPLDRWVHSFGTFVEHTHRLFAMLVGLLAIATVVASFTAQRARLPRWCAVLSLLLIIGQGALGGFRVLEKSTDLAFLHGAFGQAVFAFVGASALSFARPADALSARVAPGGSSLALELTSFGACGIVYVQMVLGAWLRHSQSQIALVVHVVMVVAVLGGVYLLGHVLGRAANGSHANETAAPDAARLFALRRALWIALATQLVLGLLAFIWVYLVVGRSRTPTELHQSLFPTLHVMGGSALLFVCVASAVQARRRVDRSAARATGSASALDARANLGGAR